MILWLPVESLYIHTYQFMGLTIVHTAVLPESFTTLIPILIMCAIEPTSLKTLVYVFGCISLISHQVHVHATFYSWWCPVYSVPILMGYVGLSNIILGPRHEVRLKNVFCVLLTKACLALIGVIHSITILSVPKDGPSYIPGEINKVPLPPRTYPGNHQGVISTPKHKIFGKMTPSCILQDFLYLFESKEIFQKFHS